MERYIPKLSDPWRTTKERIRQLPDSILTGAIQAFETDLIRLSQSVSDGENDWKISTILFRLDIRLEAIAVAGSLFGKHGSAMYDYYHLKMERKLVQTGLLPSESPEICTD